MSQTTLIHYHLLTLRVLKDDFKHSHHTTNSFSVKAAEDWVGLEDATINTLR